MFQKCCRRLFSKYDAPKTPDLYNKAGIHDVSDFYSSKFTSGGKVSLPNGVDCYNAAHLKNIWFYSNVKPGSTVLDFGCGSGTMGFLKNRGCTIYGIEYSEEGARKATEYNDYTEVFVGDIENASFKRQTFDYIVSCDVFGHILFEEKNAIIKKLSTLLKPDGTMLHGIECGKIDYSAFSQDELNKFAAVDGHIGVESMNDNAIRFSRFFKYVDTHLGYTVANTHEEYIKSINEYGNAIETSLHDYLISMSEEEKKAFNIASGLALRNMIEQKIDPSNSFGGFLFLRASNDKLEPVKLEVL